MLCMVPPSLHDDKTELGKEAYILEIVRPLRFHQLLNIHVKKVTICGMVEGAQARCRSKIVPVQEQGSNCAGAR